MYDEELDSSMNENDRKEKPAKTSHYYNNKGPGEQVRQRHPGSEHTRRHADDIPYSQTQRPRDKQKTTAIALSIITCLFMCAIGYEIIHENRGPAEKTAFNKDKKPSLIAQKTLITDDLAMVGPLDADEDESYQVKVLKAENKQQAAKIKVLRQELLEKMQALHEMKTGLFKYEADPKEKARIAELNLKLAEKEDLAQKLGLKIQAAETGLADLTRKIGQLEVTRDALVSMVETQRQSKEEEIVALRKRIEEIEQASTSGNAGAAQKIQLLEAEQQHLAASLEQKTAALAYLEKNLEQKESLLLKKQHELQHLVNSFAQSQNEVKESILDLLTVLQWEAAAKAVSENKMKQHIGLLEEEIQSRSAPPAIEKEETANQTNLQSTGETNSAGEAAALITALEWQHSQNIKDQNEHEKILDNHRQAIITKEETIQELEKQLAVQNTNPAFLADHLLSLADLYTDSDVQLHNDIQRLAASHGHESAKSGQLQNSLAAAQTETQNLLKQLAEVKEQLAAGEEQLEFSVSLYEKETARTAELEARMRNFLQQASALELHLSSADQQLSIREKEIEHLAESKHELNSAVTSARQQLKEQQQHLTDLAERLESSEGKVLEQQAQTVILERRLQEAALKTIILEDELAISKTTLKSKEAALETIRNSNSEHQTSYEQIRAELDQLRMENQTLQEEVKAILDQYLTEQQNAIELQRQLYELTEEKQALPASYSEAEYRLVEEPEENDHNGYKTENESAEKTESSIPQTRLQRMNDFKSRLRQ